MEDPLQLRPPYWGVGLEQLRERVFVPPAHVTVHESHDVQTVQPPSTKRKFKIFNINQQIKESYNINIVPKISIPTLKPHSQCVTIFMGNERK